MSSTIPAHPTGHLPDAFSSASWQAVVADPAAHLEIAAGLLRSAGWIQGELYDTSPAAEGMPRMLRRMDILGAIACARCGDPSAAESDDVDTWPAITALAAWLGHSDDPHPSHALDTWNDQDCQDAAQAVTALLDCARQLRTQNPDTHGGTPAMTAPARTVTDNKANPAIWQPLQRKEPLYRQAMNIVEAAIREGRYTRGALLPSEAELSAALGVSRPTVRQALAGLRTLGMVEVHNGKGAFVTPDWDAERCPACGQPKQPQVPDIIGGTLETDLGWVLAGLPDNQTQIWTQRLLDLLTADNPGAYRTWTAQQLAATLMNRHDLASIRIARRVGGVHAIHHGYRIADLARIAATPPTAPS